MQYKYVNFGIINLLHLKLMFTCTGDLTLVWLLKTRLKKINSWRCNRWLKKYFGNQTLYFRIHLTMFFFYLWSLISLNLSGPVYTTAVICSVIILYAHHGQSKCLNVWKQSPNIQFQIFFFFTPGSIWCQSEWISLIWWSQAHGFICEHNSSAHLLFTPFLQGEANHQ